MKEGKYHMKYLGTYMSPRKLDKDHQNILVQKVKKKIDNWASGQLSQAGKCTLLGSMTDKERKSSRLISWRCVTDKRSARGLGIRDLHILKKAILAKRILPLLNNDSNYWVQLINPKYGLANPWKKKFGYEGSWSMKCIANSMKTLRGGLQKTIGSGMYTSIWDDPWLDQIPLSRWPTFLDVNELMKYRLVLDLVMNENWNMTALNKCFGKYICTRIEKLWLENKENLDS
ncbi:hypothetical protein Cni_G07103 [Canna indica]|uniref:Reverse transcriptase n=1 Tax=Canna indica TaxID=4628 RepID=A0AAQ3Q722_9LILI|nr:hypothetical protein Cni_G07103 [Canna indica]